QHPDPTLPGFTIAGFDANGSRRFALPLSGMSQPAEVTSTGRHLYVPTHDGVGTVIVLDESSGAIVGRPLAPSAGELLSPPSARRSRLVAGVDPVLEERDLVLRPGSLATAPGGRHRA